MKRLILAGGGHAHLNVLKTLARGAWPGVEVVLVSPYARQIYSGMLPGWIAGHYTLDQCAAELAPLAAAAGVRFVEDSVVGVDAARKLIRCGKAGELSYDLLSLDTGAQLNAAGLDATAAVLLPIRPLEQFISGWVHQLAAFVAAGQARVAVVGGGAAGVELALAIRYRLTALLGSKQADVFLVEGSNLLGGHDRRVIVRVERALAEHGVQRVPGLAVGSPSGLQLADGSELAVDCIVAATGVAAADWLAPSGLQLAADGFLAVGDGQQSISHPNVFAGGDVATRVDAPHAKSGVYAVRAGPVLSDNLKRSLAGQTIASHHPPRRTLYLLATGPRRAIVSWGGWSASGGWAWRWKDWIDRRFMRQYALKKKGAQAVR